MVARRTSTARTREPAPVIDLAEARSRRAPRPATPSTSAETHATVVSCAISATVLRLPVTPHTAPKPAPAAQAAKTTKPRASVRQRFAELRTALGDGWEIVQPIFARPLWTVADDSATAFNFVLRRATATRLVTVPEGRTVERFIRDRQLTVDYRR